MYCGHCNRTVKQSWVAAGCCKCGQLLNDKTVVYVEVAG